MEEGNSRPRRLGDLTVGLTRYFAFYNGERPHQSLDYQMPDAVYASGKGGGAMIVDKYGGASVKTAAKTEHGASSSSAGGHGAPPQTPPCRELTAITATIVGVEN